VPAGSPNKAAFLPLRRAKMQSPSWNDLRYLLAVSRGRSLASAARVLAVDGTTVARRLAALQAALGARLYQRLADGTLQLTPAGERAALHAERIEREIGALAGGLSGADATVSGTVRVTAVPILVNHLLVPAAPRLLRRHPELRLELVAEPRDLSLTRRETDLALRLARPRAGGAKVTARRVGMLGYDVYAAASCAVREARNLPWITYDEAMAHLPQARWIAAAASRGGETIAALRVNDAEALRRAVIAGLGRSLLPCLIADGDARLRRLGARRGPPPLTRELWLLSHAELRNLARIEAVATWIAALTPR
jgi:DNA-binding transcriptional LysR family regulator